MFLFPFKHFLFFNSTAVVFFVYRRCSFLCPGHWMKNWSVVLSGSNLGPPAANRLLKQWKDCYCPLYKALCECGTKSHPASVRICTTLVYNCLSWCWTRARTLVAARPADTWVQIRTFTAAALTYTHSHCTWTYSRLLWRSRFGLRTRRGVFGDARGRLRERESLQWVFSLCF